MFKEFITEYQSILTICMYFLVSATSLGLAYYFLLHKKGVLPDLTKAQAPSAEVKGLVRPEGVQKDSRYVEKKASRHNKDVNRFGRWMLKHYNNKKSVKVGFLYSILKQTGSVKTYREIK